MTFPIVPLLGSDKWVNSYRWGEELDKFFPDQGAHDFTSAISCNDEGPIAKSNIVGLLMVQEGYNEGKNWIWLVTLLNGSTWWATAWCDYTGWDCQSDIEWMEYK